MKTYEDGINDAYKVILHLITADGYTAEQIEEDLTKILYKEN